VTVPDTAQAGRPLAITHTVQNIGPAPAGAFVIRFYLSTGEELQSGDALLSVRNIAGLAPGVSSRAATSVIVPTTTVVPASLRMIAVADSFDQQVEPDESNNIMVSDPLAFTAYRPELLITALGAPAAVQDRAADDDQPHGAKRGADRGPDRSSSASSSRRRRAGRQRRAPGHPRARWTRRRRQQSCLRQRDRARHDGGRTPIGSSRLPTPWASKPSSTRRTTSRCRRCAPSPADRLTLEPEAGAHCACASAAGV
jgi:CARDB